MFNFNKAIALRDSLNNSILAEPAAEITPSETKEERVRYGIVDIAEKNLFREGDFRANDLNDDQAQEFAKGWSSLKLISLLMDDT